MKIIFAPDSFKQSLSAVDAASAMAEGAHDVATDIDCDRCPVGDGGEGTLDALRQSAGGQLVELLAKDAFGRSVDATILCWQEREEVFVESASAIGMQVVSGRHRDVMRASSFGVGELIAGALDRAPQRIVVGVGGSVSNDGGCGMAQALGVRFIDSEGLPIPVPIGGGALADIAAIDIEHRDERLAAQEIVVACDVQNPLLGKSGASRIYAPQKGASAAEIEQLEAGLRHLAEIIRRDVGIDIADLPGGGAAGGLGGGLVAFAGARLASGIDYVLDCIDFDKRLDSADLCLTGEGRLDAQSLSGKACMGVARAAAIRNVPVIALVGSVGEGAEHSLAAGLSDYRVIAPELSPEESMANVHALLRAASAECISEYRNRAMKRD